MGAKCGKGTTRPYRRLAHSMREPGAGRTYRGGEGSNGDAAKAATQPLDRLDRATRSLYETSNAAFHRGHAKGRARLGPLNSLRRPPHANLLDVRVGSKPEVQRGPRNVRYWGQSGSRFRATVCLFIAKALNRSAIACWGRRFELLAVVSDSWWKLVFGVAPDHDGCSIRRRGQSAA